MVFDLLIGWSYLFVMCGPLAGPYFAASFLLWCLFFLYIFHILFLLLLVIFGCMFAIYFCLSAAAELLDFSDEFRFSHKTFYC